MNQEISRNKYYSLKTGALLLTLIEFERNYIYFLELKARIEFSSVFRDLKFQDDISIDIGNKMKRKLNYQGQIRSKRVLLSQDNGALKSGK